MLPIQITLVEDQREFQRRYFHRSYVHIEQLGSMIMMVQDNIIEGPTRNMSR
jgi:hypothetical protein